MDSFLEKRNYIGRKWVFLLEKEKLHCKRKLRDLCYESKTEMAP